MADDREAPLAVLDSRCEEPDVDEALTLVLSETGSDRPLEVGFMGCAGALSAIPAWLLATDKVAVRPSSAYMVDSEEVAPWKTATASKSITVRTNWESSWEIVFSLAAIAPESKK